MKTYLVVFASVLMAELGDKTQLATLLFATNPHVSRAGVFAAAASALVVSSLVAVLIGARIGSWIGPEHLKIVAGLAFIAIGVWMLVAR
jgi:putative Ca2+/H+ antiporter (TMEM165/GDT1 family)